MKDIKIEPRRIQCGGCGNVSIYGRGEPLICKICGTKKEE